jgi:hypothetical protein
MVKNIFDGEILFDCVSQVGLDQKPQAARQLPYNMCKSIFGPKFIAVLRKLLEMES